jgi:hypothetical protein
MKVTHQGGQCFHFRYLLNVEYGMCQVGGLCNEFSGVFEYVYEYDWSDTIVHLALLNLVLSILVLGSALFMRTSPGEVLIVA